MVCTRSADGAVKHQGKIAQDLKWETAETRHDRHGHLWSLGGPFAYSQRDNWLMLHDSAVDVKAAATVADNLHNPHGPAPSELRLRDNYRSFAYNGLDTAGKFGSGMSYAGVRAKLFAYREDTLYALLDNNGAGQRGGTHKEKEMLAKWAIAEVKQPTNKSPALADKEWSRLERVRYRVKQDAWDNYQLLAVAGDKVVVNEASQLIVASARTGDELSRVELPALPVFGGIAIADGQVIVTCRDGSIVCLR